MTIAKELFIADAYGRETGRLSEFTKASPPKMGEQFGVGWGDDRTATYQLPGGGLLAFDLDKLTLQDYRAMRTHYQVNVSLSVLVFMLHQIDWKIECDDKKIEDFCNDQIEENWTRLIRGIGQAYWAGYSPVVVQWKNNGITGKIEIDKFKDLRPEDARVHWKDVEGYAPPGQAKPKLRVYDGIDHYSHSSYAMREGSPSNKKTRIPPENTLWYPLLMENGDHYGKKLLKPAFAPWFFSQLLHLFANRYFERFGEPLPIGRAPFDDEVDMGNGTTSTGRDVMQQIVTNIRNRSAVVLPSDRAPGGNGDRKDFEYQIEYLESQMRGADFERYMNRLDEEMSLGIFTPVLLYRTADVGSYNLGEAHERIFLIMINSLIGDLTEYVDRYLLDRLVDFNFSPNSPRARFKWRKQGKEAQATLRAILQSMIQGERAKVDVEDLGQALGMKVTEIKQVVAEPGSPAAAGGGTSPSTTDTSSDGSPVNRGGTRPSENALEQIGDLMTSRVAGQVEKAWRGGRFDEMNLSMGYTRRMESELVEAGYEHTRARSMTLEFSDRVNAWSADAIALGASAYDGPEVFIERFENVVQAELEAM